MGLFAGLFKRSASNSITQMRGDTDVIQMAVAVKLFAQYQTEFSEDRAATIAAAVCNKLFGKTSSDHTDEDLKLAEQLAAETLRSDSEVRDAALMSCRARLLCEIEKNSEERWKVWDTIQWMGTICDLPSDEAEPTIIRQLASRIHAKYLRKT